MVRLAFVSKYPQVSRLIRVTLSHEGPGFLKQNIFGEGARAEFSRNFVVVSLVHDYMFDFRKFFFLKHLTGDYVTYIAVASEKQISMCYQMVTSE